jgi:uncharacterized protein YaeQ
MALKPTIYKMKLALTDLDREVYENLSLTVACHPSETLERMMVRVLAYSLNVCDGLELCKSLSDTEEADLWAHSLDGALSLWIDVGEPTIERIKKVSRLAPDVRLYSFNSKSPTWWELSSSDIAKLPISVFRFDWAGVQALAKTVERTMEFSITVSEGSLYVSTSAGDCELRLEKLQDGATHRR